MSIDWPTTFLGKLEKRYEDQNNPCGSAAGIGGSVCVNYLCPVEAGGGGMKDEALDLALEPVGEVTRYGLDSHGRKWHGIHWYDPNVDVPHGTKLYTTPPAAPVQEPDHGDELTIAYMSGLHDGKKKRQWGGLTDEEIDLFINGRGDEDDDDYVEPTGDGFGLTDADLVELVRRAEAKLKEKNT